MAKPLRRPSLDSATLAVLSATIVADACSASWSTGLRDAARPFRAMGFVALCALALAGAAARKPRLRDGRLAFITAAAFLLVAAASAAWSVAPRSTIGRLAGLALLLVAAAALSARAASDRRAARRVLWAVLAGAAVVAVVGVGIYLVSSSDALQPATGQAAARFRGLGENPNTVSMLFAAALPLAVLLFVEARERWTRTGAALLFLLLAGSIAFSGSRGALVGACAALLVLGLGAARRHAVRAALAGAVAVFAAAVIGIGSIPSPLSPAEAARLKTPSANTERRTPNDAEYVIRLEDEIGYSKGDSSGRDWLSGSGRLDAWRGALNQAADRPLLGYGFGTEAKTFVDRYEAFQGGVPENSYVGVVLQLGYVGLAFFLCLLAALAVAAIRLVRDDPILAATCAGVLACGLVLAVVQSYLYAIGNTAAVAVWICAFLPAAARIAR